MHRNKKITVLLLFCLIKIFQFGSSFILGEITGSERDSLVFVYIFSIVITYFVTGIIIERYFSQFKKILAYFGAIAIAIIIIFSIVGYGAELIIYALFGIYFYTFLSLEKQIIANIENILFMPRFIPLLISIAIGLISLFGAFYYSGAAHYNNYIFIISSILSFLASYSVKITEGNVVIMLSQKPPIFLGIFFLAGSLIFYLLLRSETNFPEQLLYFIFFFYYGGLVILYINVDDYIKNKLRSKSF